jgi:hypothetical protein
MPDLKDKFSRKEWKDCCGKGCRKCEIAQAYIGTHGRGDGLTLLRADRQDVLAKKGKKGGKKGKKGGKKGKKK